MWSLDRFIKYFLLKSQVLAGIVYKNAMENVANLGRLLGCFLYIET